MPAFKKKRKILSQIAPSIALIREYQGYLKPLIEAMRRSVQYWVKNPYKDFVELQTPEEEGIKDTSPAVRINKTLKKIKRKYAKEFNEAADKVAKKIVGKTQQDVSRRLRYQLKDVMSVDIAITRRVNNVMLASRAENVSYIRSIPQKYFADVERVIMQTVKDGRDMFALQEELQKRYDLTFNRAYFLAQDQIKKTYEVLERTAKQDIGLFKEIWRHSPVSRVPRKSHERADGKEYDNRRGCYIDGEYIHPKEKPGCNCFSQTVVEL
jgi:uncharacterized protein with gpF-like domain